MTITSRLLLPFALAACATAAAVPGEALQSRGFVSLPLTRHTRAAPLARRDGEVPLFNISATSYLIEMSIGTPGQKVKVAIDTGSNELWVDPNCEGQGLEAEQTQECEADGVYNPSSSSTAKGSTSVSTIQYGSGAVAIQYAADDVALPGSGIKLSALQFGIATESQGLNEGILGLGFGQGTNLAYPNFVDALASQKQTNTKAFSVALGSVDAADGGAVVFGGVDTKKFAGRLAASPILGPQGGDAVARYWVQMESVSLNSSTLGSHAYPGGSTPVVLDTGSSLSVLPASVVQGMVDDFGAQADQASGLYLVPCATARGARGTVDFAFAGVTIRVPIDAFVWQASDTQCVLGAQAADPGSGVTALLGDTFLRSAYVVFDQTNNQILMAPYQDCGTDERAIPAGKTGASAFTGCGTSSAEEASESGSSGAKSAAARPGGPSVGAGVLAAAALAVLVDMI